MKTVHPTSIPLLAFFLVATACGDSEPKKEARCTSLHLEASEAVPLDELALEGIPKGFGEFLAARVTATEGGPASLTLVARQDDDSVILHAPIHPAGQVEGGEVELQIIDQEGRSCGEPIPFRILPLPEASGAVREVARDLALIIQEQARFFETTVEELRETPLEELAVHLIPLYLAQHSLDDPSNPDSLDALLAGTAPILEGVPPALHLMDSLFARVGFPDAIAESLAELRDVIAAGEEATRGHPMRLPPSALTSRHGPTNATQLDAEMEMAQWGRGFLGDGGLAQATRGLGTLTGLGGLIPFPPAKAGAMVAGSSIFTFLKSAEAAAMLLPSRFVSLDFELSPESLDEDSTMPGQWRDARVVATSEGWALDQAVLETLLQFTKVKGGYDAWFNRLAPEGLKKSIAGQLTPVVNQVIKRTAGGSGMINIPATRTEPIDITDEPWSFGEVHYALREVGRRGYELDPDWPAELRGEVKVGTALGRFGGQHIYQLREVEIAPLTISISPSSASVDPGESVDFQVTVRNARDPATDVHAENGMTRVDGQPGSSYVIRYTAPDSEDELPDTLTVTSLSEGGMFANPGRPKARAVALIRGKKGEVVISPGSACLKPGEAETFGAEVFGLDDQRVRWDATAGTITQAGVFTAPSAPGSVTITATSVEDENASASISITVGSCTCSWSAEISGGPEASFSGENFILGYEDGKVGVIWFVTSTGMQISMTHVLVDVFDGLALGATGTFDVSASADIRRGDSVSGYTDSFGTPTPPELSRRPISLDLHTFDVGDGSYTVEGSLQGSGYWGSIDGEYPEEHTDWPGSLQVSFQGVLDKGMTAGTSGTIWCSPPED